MKKSTVLLVALIYVISFLIVGIFGISVRGYHNNVYVESIKITDPDNGAAGLVVKEPDLETEDYYFFVRYKTDLTVRVEARVLPDNTTFPEVNYSWDLEQGVFTLEKVDKIYAVVHFNKKGSARFVAESTDGEKVQSRILIIAQ